MCRRRCLRRAPRVVSRWGVTESFDSALGATGFASEFFGDDLACDSALNFPNRMAIAGWRQPASKVLLFRCAGFALAEPVAPEF